MSPLYGALGAGSSASACHGATFTILDSGKKGTQINWTVEATDESGNITSADCETQVVK